MTAIKGTSQSAKSQAFVYKNGESQLVDEATAEDMKSDGWCDNPNGDKSELQTLREENAKLEAQVSGPVDLGKMNKDDLEAYARKEYDVELDKRKSKATLISEIKTLASASNDGATE